MTLSEGLAVANRESCALAELPPTTTLQKIADVLGCTIDEFAGDRGASRPPSGAELLKLWDRLPDEAARRRVLAVARALAK